MIDGSLLIRDGHIAAIESGPHAGPGEDMDGDLLLPGLVELHTDHIEKHMKPRPGVSVESDDRRPRA